MAFPPFTRDFTDVAGNLLSGPITLRFIREDSGRPVQVYGDFAGTDPLGSTPGFADTRVQCFPAEPGLYRIEVSASGYSRTLRYQPVGLAQATNVAFSQASGAWTISGIYQQGYYVSHEGSTFLSRVDDNEGNEPDSTTPGDTAEWMYVPTIGGTSVAEVLQALGVNSITISTDPPSGGMDNDIWLQV